MTTAASDRDDLLRAVIADPAADTPRLVFADWLDDHGRDGVECPGCKPWAHAVHWVTGHTPNPYSDPYWQVCRKCGGSAVVPNGYAERAAFVRADVSVFRDGPARLAETRKLFRKVYPDTDRYLFTRSRTGPGFETPARPRVLIRCLVRRGFVAEVRGPLAFFWAACGGGCDGSGAWAEWRTPRPCPHCGGKGQWPTGAFVDLARVEPIEAVRLTDRRPMTPPDGPGRRWCRRGGIVADRDDYAWELPDRVFHALPHAGAWRVRDDFVDYDTENDATAAVTAALLKVARA